MLAQQVCQAARIVGLDEYSFKTADKSSFKRTEAYFYFTFLLM